MNLAVAQKAVFATGNETSKMLPAPNRLTTCGRETRGIQDYWFWKLRFAAVYCEWQQTVAMRRYLQMLQQSTATRSEHVATKDLTRLRPLRMLWKRRYLQQSINRTTCKLQRELAQPCLVTTRGKRGTGASAKCCAPLAANVIFGHALQADTWQTSLTS